MGRNSMQPTVVYARPGRGWLRLLAVLLLGIVLGATGWPLLLESTDGELLPDSGRFSGLLHQREQLNEDNEQLRHRIGILEQAAVLDRQALAVLQEENKATQDALYQVRGELESYEGIMGASHKSGGLTIQGLYLQPVARSGQVHYKVVLTHIAKDGKNVQGTMGISLQGGVGDQARSYRLDALSAGGEAELPFDFMNFKVFEGYLDLPEGFTPSQATVRLRDTAKKQLAERVFDWPQT